RRIHCGRTRDDLPPGVGMAADPGRGVRYFSPGPTDPSVGKGEFICEAGPWSLLRFLHPVTGCAATAGLCWTHHEQRHAAVATGPDEHLLPLACPLSLQRHLIHSQMCLYARVRSLLDLVSLRVLSAGRGPHVLRLLRCWNFWW